MFSFPHPDRNGAKRTMLFSYQPSACAQHACQPARSAPARAQTVSHPAYGQESGCPERYFSALITIKGAWRPVEMSYDEMESVVHPSIQNFLLSASSPALKWSIIY